MCIQDNKTLTQHWHLLFDYTNNHQLWEDELVIYNPNHGDTHLSNIIADSALKSLQHKPCSGNELLHNLSTEMHLESSTQLTEPMIQLLLQLESQRLIKRISHHE